MAKTKPGVFTMLLSVAVLSAFDVTATENQASQNEALLRCHDLDDRGNSQARNCYLALINTQVNDVVRGEALWRIDDFVRANRAFRRANQATPDNADLLTRWGMLFLEVQQTADAEALFEQALAIEPMQTDALLGQAELMANRFEARAQGLINDVLSREPENHRAKLLLARLQLEVGEVEQARHQLKWVLDDDDSANNTLPATRLDAYALLAAADLVEGSVGTGHWTEKALELNRGFADIYAVPAYFYVITRRYSEAVDLLLLAVELDPDHWQAHSDLGMNLLRLNRFEEAREHLERAYSGYPFSAEVVNTLRLLDSLSDFDTISSPNLLLRVHKSESAVLQPYVQDQVDRVDTEMAARYGFERKRPVVVELYQHHDDFAVRTAGLPGIGILGATFGDVIVMDGPSAKTADEFDWASALWHELAHVVTLNATHNLVSRWFSEGVSELEEWRYGPSPTDSIPPNFLNALKEDRLLPVASLDEGFMRPSYQGQIMVSYLQAGLVCLFIADTFEGGLVRMLASYRDGANTVEAITQSLSITAAELDERFNEYLQNRFGPVLSSLETFTASNQQAATALKEERWQEAQVLAEQAIASYPDYIGPASPYLLLARAQDERRHFDEATTTLERYWQRGGRNPSALQKLAQNYYAANKIIEAIEVQQVLSRAQPFAIEHHRRLGEWLLVVDDHSLALREFQAVLSLQPHDKADAHYKVASAFYALDQVEASRRELLYALEIAPRYLPALSLLVEMNK